MDDSEQKTIPTASDDMLLPTSVTSRNQLTNGAMTKKSSRIRSKSESHHPSSDKQKELYGVVIKSAKDRAHDRKPRNMKGSGKPKKGKYRTYLPREWYIHIKGTATNCIDLY